MTMPLPIRPNHLTSHTALRYAAPAERLDAVLVLAHGAGAGQSHPFMVRYARGLAARGLDVVTFDFPYRVAGRRTPDRAPVLQDALREIVAAASAEAGGSRVFIGGKSMGGRIATHLAAQPEHWPASAPLPSGVVVFGYPLTPPGGRASADRVSHLGTLAVPTLIVQGTRDRFGGPEDLRKALEGRRTENEEHRTGNEERDTKNDERTTGAVTIVAVEGGDHSLAVPKSSGRSQDEVDHDVWDAVVAFVRGC